MDAFQAYTLYLALKRHFTPGSGYDYFKYNGKTNASKTAFETRNDKYSFHKLSKKADPLQFLVANFSEHGPGLWIGDLISNEKYENTYKNWVKKKESLSYIIKEDLSILDTDIDTNFKVIEGQYPKLLTFYLKKKINLETIIILNNILNFVPKWKRDIRDVTLWPDIYNKIVQTQKFLVYDKEKIHKLIVKELV